MAKKKIKTKESYPKLSIADFEQFASLQLDDMIKKDRYKPSVEGHGAKTFGEAGLRDEGYGVIVKCKDGGIYTLTITEVKPESDPVS
jgi:hypothetical protein